MSSITLKHLRYFLAVADRGHFAHAADACAVSQPALSVQIKHLEELTGATLLERTTRKVHLTPAGQLLADHARQIVTLVEDIGDVLRSAESDLAGPMRLGVIPTIAPYFFPKILAGVSARFPRLDLDMREAVTPVLIEELTTGQIDSALVALPIDEPELAEAVVTTERFVLVRPSKDRDKPVPDVTALQEMKLLLLEEGHCFRTQALAFCDVQARNYRNIMNANSLTTLVQLVASGIGMTLIPEMAARLERQIADVDMRYFPDQTPSRTIGLVWRRSHPLRHHFQTLLEVVRKAAADLRSSEGPLQA